MSATHGDRGRAKVVRIAVALVAAAALLLTGCSRGAPVYPSADPTDSGASPSAPTGTPPPDAEPDGNAPPGAPEAPDAPPATAKGGTGTASDQLAGDVVAGVEGFWREQFPTQFGRRWVNIHGFEAVDPGDAAVPAPCLHRALDLTDQALYCSRLDTVAWDRVGLLPRLRGTYGDAAVLVALAHEIGHAVQDRLGIDAAAQVREPDRYPTILLEGMADCFAGVVVRAAVDGKIAKLAVTRARLDRAMRALLSFRDPVGVAISR
ncbi:MAG TPA: neutral zinc metallopeptidase, partial [Pseudonocardia sp.]|nr:neutral zinc metallopeptidase [Pseudonocardia sp.]